MNAPVLDTALLRRFDKPGPRYTSYPTADRFTDAIDPSDLQAALRGRAANAPLGLYVHIPFCESVCYYCACNKIVTRRHERSGPYLDLLEREVTLVEQTIGRRERVTQLHLGGGTPTFLSDDELTRLLGMLRRAFDIVPGAELAIEVDPRTVDYARLAHLAALGFNRLSFGVQDFDPDVQRAVHREQSYEQVFQLMQGARTLGFDSINLDLIYGLPKQNAESFKRTIEQVAGLAPDRIALYAYAHLPERFAPQRRIHAEDLPSPAERVAMLQNAVNDLLAEDYAYIGMDHFARRDDALAVAQREGRLRRNFQGYAVGSGTGAAAADDLIALGVSAISQVGGVFWQNAKTLIDYEEVLKAGKLPVIKGLVSTADDALRRDVIMALMCRGRVDWRAIEARHDVRVAEVLAEELAELEDMVEGGVLRIDDDGIEVTPAGWYVVRAIAMVFDAHLRRRVADGTRRFSRIL
jgi:oxygen-independent coproporphyrinogen-3 oxidase